MPRQYPTDRRSCRKEVTIHCSARRAPAEHLHTGNVADTDWQRLRFGFRAGLSDRIAIGRVLVERRCERVRLSGCGRDRRSSDEVRKALIIWGSFEQGSRTTETEKRRRWESFMNVGRRRGKTSKDLQEQPAPMIGLNLTVRSMGCRLFDVFVLALFSVFLGHAAMIQDRCARMRRPRPIGPGIVGELLHTMSMRALSETLTRTVLQLNHLNFAPFIDYDSSLHRINYFISPHGRNQIHSSFPHPHSP